MYKLDQIAFDVEPTHAKIHISFGNYTTICLAKCDIKTKYHYIDYELEKMRYVKLNLANVKC